LILAFRIVRSRISSGVVMRLRHTLTVGVCLLMMCATSLASACELSCSLPSNHRHVSTSERVQKPEVMSASHCAHMQRSGAHDGWPNSITQTSSCVDRPCWRSDVSSLAMKASANPQFADHLKLTPVVGQPEPFNFKSIVSPAQLHRQAVPSPPLSTVLQI
jgi:hypothetical protein